MKFRVFSMFILLTLLVMSVSAINAQDSESAFPVTIEHKFGETTITEMPERVVALGFTEQDPWLALGVQPVAVRYWYGDAPNAIFPWAIDEADGYQPVMLEMAYGSLDYEAILALQPDLISAVDAGITQEEYDFLSAIAPTIAQSDEYVDFGTPWQETTRTIGMAAGQPEEAEALVTNIEDRLIEIREANPQFEGVTVAVAYHTGETYGYYTDQDGRGRFFTDLGFVVPDELNELAGDSFYYYISEERVDLLDQGLLVFLALQFYEEGSEVAQAAIMADPLLSQLNVVQRNNVLFIRDEFDDALQFGTVLSLEFLLDGLVPEILEIYPAESMADATCEAGFRTVVDATDTEMCLPENPARIITLTDGDTDALVALGVDPTGVSNGRGSQTPPRYLLDDLSEDYVSVGDFYQPNPEVLLELEPDLILFSYGDYAPPEMIEQLNEIAPVFISAAGDDTWQDLFIHVGEALNMETSVEAFFAEYERRVESISTFVEPDTQFMIARWSAEGPQVMAPYIFAPSVLQDVGLVMPEDIPDLQQGHAHSAPLSLETLGVLDVDWLFLGTLQAEGDAVDALEAVFDNPLFQQLEVVQSEQVIVIDGSVWTSSGGPTAANIVLDILEENLSGD